MANLIGHPSTRWRRVVTVAVALLALATLAACDGEDQKKAACGEGTSHGCFDLSSYGHLYCTVVQARGWLADGRLKPSDLPDWADTAQRRGSVLIFDFRNPPKSDLTGAQYTQQLLNAVHAKDLLQDADSLTKRKTCLDDLTQRKVAASEGGWPSAQETDR